MFKNFKKRYSLTRLAICLLLIAISLFIVACAQSSQKAAPLPTSIPTLDVAQFSNIGRYSVGRSSVNESPQTAPNQPVLHNETAQTEAAQTEAVQAEAEPAEDIETKSDPVRAVAPDNDSTLGSETESNVSPETALNAAPPTPLQVTSTQPNNGSTDVSTDGQIVVVFNRPIVPLVGANEQTSLPHPLTFDPPVEGRGKWLNTSIYAFQPAMGLAGATTYATTVAELAGLDGTPLQTAHHFTFTTAPPTVVKVRFKRLTSDGTISTVPMMDYNTRAIISPDSYMEIIFSQTMDPESTEAALHLFQLQGDSPISIDGTVTWNETRTLLTFTPTAPFELSETYFIKVDDSAQPASRQGYLREDFVNFFSVVPSPNVYYTTPKSGQKNVQADSSVTIRFNTPVSRTSLLDNVQISPPLTNTYVYSYYAPYSQEFILDWHKQPNQPYTVTIGAAVADDYGNQLGEEYQLNFTTGNYRPFTQIELDQVTHFSAYTETLVSLLYRNTENVDAALYRLPLAEFHRLTGDNQRRYWDEGYQVPDPETNLVWERSYPSGVGANVIGRQLISLTHETGELLPPGLYFLEVDPPTQSESPLPRDKAQVLIVLSNHNLVFKEVEDGPNLAWLTDLRTGQPVVGQDIFASVEDLTLAVGQTDETGVAWLDIDHVGLSEAGFRNSSNHIKSAVSGVPGDENFAIVTNRWNDGITSWEFDMPIGPRTQSYQTHFYTDRPIYRAGQTIHWKGLIRAYADNTYQLPPTDLPVNITIQNHLGATISQGIYRPNEHGTIHGSVELAPEAMSGSYRLIVKLPRDDLPGRYIYGGTSFEVAAYQKPEFEIAITTDQPEYIHGDTIQATAQANFFSGGPLAEASVTWRVLATPYSFSWQGMDNKNQFFSFTPYDPERARYDPYVGFNSRVVAEGSGTTDADGQLLLEIPADLGNSIQSQEWTLDVTVQSATNQFVSEQIMLPIHRGAFYVGLSPQHYVTAAQEKVAIDVITVRPQGEAYPDVDLAATVYAFEWNSVYAKSAGGGYYWETSVERTPLYSATLMTDSAGIGQFDWIPEAGGQYQVVVRGEDAAGNLIQSATFLWVSSKNVNSFVAWPRENNDRIELVADKALYRPGETAKVLVPSPFSGAVEALVTIERGGILEQSVVTLNGNSEILSLPITTAHIPNIFVSVVLIKGVDETNPLPAMRVGYLQLNVDVSAKALAIEIEPSATTVEPNETVAYTLTVVDSQGEPSPNTEVSVALIDKAILSLAGGDGPSLLDSFYYERSLGVDTSALLTINQDRLSQQLSEGSKGGGGGGFGPVLQLREEFSDVAFWHADFVTDDQGQITFDVALPDNLTAWRLMAVAISDDTLVGNGTNDILATKALQIRPLLPRFFTAGDQATIGAVVINHSDIDFTDGTMTIDIQGGTLGNGQGSGDSQNSGDFALAQGKQIHFDYPITVDSGSTQVVITFTAQSSPQSNANSLSDALRLTLPVHRYEMPETVSTAGTVPATGQLESILLPESATDTGELMVTIEQSLAAGMADGLDYLQHYPYECNEQTVSRFLPNLFTTEALNTLGLNEGELATNLETELQVGTQRLVNRQNPDGGWGYWAGEVSNPFITAYVVWGLWHVQAMDHPLPEQTLKGAIAYLDRNFTAPKDVTQNWKLNQMAFMHFVLSEMGEGDPGRMGTLFDVRERLGLYGQAYLAMAMANVQPVDTPRDLRVQTLLDGLLMQAQISATGAFWQESKRDSWTLSTDIRTTGIVLATFARLDPQEPLLPQAVRWLMSARKAGRWSNTQESAWSIIALTRWLEASGELNADYEWRITLNDDELGSGSADEKTLFDQVELGQNVADLLRGEANLLRFDRSSDQGALYYTTHLRYYLEAQDVASHDQGIVVDRLFEMNGEMVNSARVGDIISVTVTLIAPTSLYQTLVEVPIPAGTEPIDASLDTTSILASDPTFGRVDTPRLPNRWWSYWRPTHTDIQDEKVALVSSYLQAGTYEYTFQVRATVPGTYNVLPVHAEQIYFTEIWGRSSGGSFSVTK